MRIYRTQKEFEADIKDNVFVSSESIDITAFNLDIEANIEVERDINAGNIKAWNINAKDINAGNINAWNINAKDINAGNINAGNIKAWDINAGNINAGNINAGNINAWNINAGNIDAKKIEYYAVAFAYQNIKCKSIKGTRENARHFVLDGKIIEEDK